MGIDAEQLQVQLAGCLTAAEGGVSDDVVAKPGDYGWSQAYQAVVDLRRKYEKLVESISLWDEMADGGWGN